MTAVSPMFRLKATTMMTTGTIATPVMRMPIASVTRNSQPARRTPSPAATPIGTLGPRSPSASTIDVARRLRRDMSMVGPAEVDTETASTDGTRPTRNKRIGSAA